MDHYFEQALLILILLKLCDSDAFVVKGQVEFWLLFTVAIVITLLRYWIHQKDRKP